MENSETKTCKDCLVEKPVGQYLVKSGYLMRRCADCYTALIRERNRRRHITHREYNVKRMRNAYALHRRQVFDHYGSFCACCGEGEVLFLTIDHVNNDGARHRKTNSRSIHNNIYAWLVRNGFPEGFQVLCRNCNWGKQANGGVCPHAHLEGSTIISQESRGQAIPKRPAPRQGMKT